MRLALMLATALLLAACSPKADTAAPDASQQVNERSVVSDPAPPEPTLDPTELDLSKIALAMRIPSAFRADDDGAALQINLTSPRLGVDIAETFPLVITADVESQFLTSQLKDGFSIWTFGTRAEDSARLAALSAQVARLKVEAPGENELTFGALASGCWAEPEETPGSLARTLYIRVMPEDDFQVFVPEQVLAEADPAGIETFWGACEG
jgi:hypothetical protein